MTIQGSERLIHWRTWLNLGSLALSICLLIVLLGSSLPHALLGLPISKVLQSIAQWGFYTSIFFFFLAVTCLLRSQRKRKDT